MAWIGQKAIDKRFIRVDETIYSIDITHFLFARPKRSKSGQRMGRRFELVRLESQREFRSFVGQP
jgi:hypothetical protein